MSRTSAPFWIAILVSAMSVDKLSAQSDMYRLAEVFDPGKRYRVEVKVEMAGEVAVPGTKEQPAKSVRTVGASLSSYAERVLPADEDRAARVVRLYRELNFQRVIGDREQKADVRASVRRMVVMRNPAGAKVPFSPDGPFTWGEIDAVRTDLFIPVLVPGLLPGKDVTPGDDWPVAAAAVTDLTEMEKIVDGGLKMKFVSTVTVGGKKMARLALSGTVTGITEDGPCRDTLDGTAYFDLDAGMLTHFSLNGTHELLDPSGKVTGKITGRFTLSRKPAEADDLTDRSLELVVLKPTPENTLLFYNNPDLGVRFVYPRSWRVGTVQGKQVSLEHTRKGGGILVTLEPPAKVPTANQFLAEARDQVKALKGKVLGEQRPTVTGSFDRFSLDAEIGGQDVKLVYAILRTPDGGATFAARLPEADAAELGREIDRILKDLELTKSIK
jgi:hypothetical protein